MNKQTKKCCQCKRIKKYSEFHKAASRKDGLQAVCKACILEYQHSPKTKQYNLEWQRKPKAKEYKKRYYQMPTAKFSLYKRVAKKRNHPFKLSFEEFMTFWGKPCCYCGTTIETIGLDQIVPGNGYSLTNVRPCCWACNRMKFNRAEEEFLAHIKKLVEYRVGHNLV